MKEMQKLIEYIRGSQLYGLNNQDSDIDKCIIYSDTLDNLLSDSITEFENIDKGDEVHIEIGKFMGLLAKSNPNMLEALFADDEFVLYCHPAFKKLRNIRDQFLSKDIFNALGGYAVSQIRKAKGLNKKINNPQTQQPQIYNYMFVAWNQGSVPLKKYIELNYLPDYKKLKQNEIDAAIMDIINHIGITSIPNMDFIYGAYIKNDRYKGFISPDGHQLIFSDTDKGDTPAFYIHYNKDKYSTACREYKEYKDWEKNRNPVRYQSNLSKNYDSKNMMHCFRLLTMAVELAEKGEFNLDRRNIDRDFLMDIRNHKYEYDELMEKMISLEARLQESREKSNLREHVDKDLIKKSLLEIRKEILINN